jgi:hypothetical protein
LVHWFIEFIGLFISTYIAKQLSPQANIAESNYRRRQQSLKASNAKLISPQANIATGNYREATIAIGFNEKNEGMFITFMNISSILMSMV